MTAQSEIWGTDSVKDAATWADCRRRGDGVAPKPASFCHWSYLHLALKCHGWTNGQTERIATCIYEQNNSEAQ